MLSAVNPSGNAHETVRSAKLEAQECKGYYLEQRDICLEIRIDLEAIEVPYSQLLSIR